MRRTMFNGFLITLGRPDNTPVVGINNATGEETLSRWDGQGLWPWKIESLKADGKAHSQTSALLQAQERASAGYSG